MSRTNTISVSEHSLTGEKLSLLAVFAHPEDETFGPAGTLAKYVSEGVQVSLVTATRAAKPVSDIVILNDDECFDRDRSCACRTSGVRRACFLGYQPGELDKVDESIIEDQLVRLIREIRPQVIVTYGVRGHVDDADHQVISRVTTLAFHDSGDAAKFPHQFREGLGPYAPQKLYYCVLPASFISRWQIQGLSAVPDERVTTVLDISSHNQAMSKALFCQRSGSTDFIQWMNNHPQLTWDAEYYELAESTLAKKARREKDLFAGLR